MPVSRAINTTLTWWQVNSLLDSLAANHKEKDAAHKRNPPDNGGDWENVLLLGVDLEGPEVYCFFSRGIAKALINKGHDTDNDEEDGNCRFGIHFREEWDFKREEAAHKLARTQPLRT